MLLQGIEIFLVYTTHLFWGEVSTAILFAFESNLKTIQNLL